jgi:5-methyltetrahydrofolate--homocysteine methyltransferase
MVYLAKELDKQNIKIPIDWWCNYLAGSHRCEIAPQYRQTVIHVNDASRAVTVAKIKQ